MVKCKVQGASSSRLIILPSLLAQISTTNRKPKAEFLLGLGEPFEPNSWDISEGEDDEKDLLMAAHNYLKPETMSRDTAPPLV